MLSLLQRGLETLYRLDPSPDVTDFVVDDERRRSLGVERAPREQLLVREPAPGELELGLYVDPATLATLAANDPRAGVGEHNLAELCLAVEGVSHYVYVSFRARADVPVSALELELQAEVDKYVTCRLLGAGGSDDRLHEKLFHGFSLAEDLSAEERERYATANALAARYASHLETRYAACHRIPDMLDELRRFYRLRLAEKRDHIGQAA